MNKLLFTHTEYDFVVLPAPHNKKIRTKRVNNYYACRDALAEVFQKKMDGKPPLTKVCRVKAIVCRKTRRQADFDNLGKTVCDALTKGGVLADDSQVYLGEVIKRVGWHRDYISISVYEYDGKKEPL